MLTNDHGICIRAVDYSETSQVVTFFARQTGKVPLIAKGAKRQKSSFLMAMLSSRIQGGISWGRLLNLSRLRE